MAAKKSPKRAAPKARAKKPTAKRAAGKPALAKPAGAKAPAKKPAPSAKQQRVDRAQVARTYAKLRERHSDAHCELDHQNAFQLILATVLSAQSTDVMVNKITPELFKR
jgi:endonuclease-3